MFLDELSFSMTSEAIAAIRPGAVLKLEGGKVVVQYVQTDKVKPQEQTQATSPPLEQIIQPVHKKWWQFWK